MSKRKRTGFPVFETATVIALALIGWTAFRLYEVVPRVDEGRGELNVLKADYFEIAEHLQNSVAALSDCMTNYLQGKEPAELVQFQQQGQELREWIEAKRRHWLAAEKRGFGVTNAATPSVKIKNQ